MDKKDYRILVLVLLAMALAIIGTVVYNEYQNRKVITILDMNITQGNYEIANEFLSEDYLDYYICNLKSGNCVRFENIDNYKEVME